MQDTQSEPKWTPGPWDKVVKRDGFTAVGADTLIARVFSRAFMDLANEEANAHLIAAAPDLYAALADLLATVKAVPEMNHQRFDPLGVKVLAALARARGGK